MKHPEFLLLPIMMFADYFLTVLGAVRQGKRYGHHIKTPHYELNPLWQSNIAKRQWFSLRHTLLVLVLSGVLLYFVEFGQMPERFIQWTLGCLFVCYGMVLGGHIGNILTFSYLIAHPEEISGEVMISHRLVLVMSLAQQAAATLVMGLIAVFSPTDFVYGGVVGLVGLIILKLVWMLKENRRRAQTGSPNLPGHDGLRGE